MKLRFSRLSLLTKIMLSTSVAITVLFAIAGQIVQIGRASCRERV